MRLFEKLQVPYLTNLTGSLRLSLNSFKYFNRVADVVDTPDLDLIELSFPVGISLLTVCL